MAMQPVSPGLLGTEMTANEAAAGVQTDASDATVEAGHRGDPIHVEALSRVIWQAEVSGKIRLEDAKRLQALLLLFDSSRQKGLVEFEAPTDSQKCILGWLKVLVIDPKAFNDRIRQMVARDTDSLWRKNTASVSITNAVGDVAMPHAVGVPTNPTWKIYEILRKIGAKPKYRGPVETDPGEHDMLYYKEWKFENDEATRKIHKRAADVQPERGPSRKRLVVQGDSGAAPIRSPYAAPTLYGGLGDRVAWTLPPTLQIAQAPQAARTGATTASNVVDSVLTRHEVGRCVDIFKNWNKDTGNNVVRVKLCNHAGDQTFCVQFLPSNHRQVLDFSRLEYQLVHEKAVQVVPIWPKSGRSSESALVMDGREGGVKGQALLDLNTIEDIDAFKLYAEEMAEVAIKTTALSRLFSLFQLIRNPDAGVTLNHLDIDNSSNNCVLGFYKLEVQQPTFNNKVRELVNANKLWHGLSGSRDIKNPTWVVYELLRQIGVRPQKHCRGPKEHDPDPKDFMYVKRYVFSKDTFYKNHHRLRVDGIY